MYPPLPTCTLQLAGETLPEYAARVLRHLLATDCTATLTDEQLSLADMAAQLAASQLKGGGDPTRADRPDLPSRVDGPGLAAIETLSACRRTIALVLDWRRRDDLRRATEALIPPSYPTGGSQGGRLAPLNPPPPAGPGSPTALPLPSLPARRPADGIRF